MSLSTGLISGMDTGTLVAQLVAAEAAPQTALKTRLADTEKAASAYRTVNTTFLAVTATAEAALKPELWTSAKGTSSAASVTVAPGTKPIEGSLTFTVDEVATNHGVVNRNSAWTSATSPYGAGTIEIKDAQGVTRGTVALGATGTLTDAAAKINADPELGLSAAVVQIRGGATPEFALQLSSRTSGADSTFEVVGAGTFGITAQGKDAKLTIGEAGAAGSYSVYSDTNSFDAVLPGATLTVSKKESTPVTVTVAADPDAVAAKMQTLVDAVNAAISTVKTYTSNATGSTAALKGDFSVSSLAGRLQDALSFAVGSDGSPVKLGLQLTRDGKVTFDKEKFTAALKEDPALAQRMIAGAPAGTAPDGAAVPAVTGIAQRLAEVTKAASDSATGSLVKLAEGQDSMGKDIQARIEAWDLRLAKRKEMLTRQFTAMETALSSLRNQSTWLAGQINSLPSSS